MSDEPESFGEQLSRIRQMAYDDGDRWDLSPNDKAALLALFAEYKRLRAAHVPAPQEEQQCSGWWHLFGKDKPSCRCGKFQVQQSAAAQPPWSRERSRHMGREKWFWCTTHGDYAIIPQCPQCEHDAALHGPEAGPRPTADDAEALRLVMANISRGEWTEEQAEGWQRYAARWRTRWTGLMAGFAPAETDRSTTNSRDVGGPTK